MIPTAASASCSWPPDESRKAIRRCPSELLSLEWRHVDWERNRITVPSPKTDRYDVEGSRTIPLFPEL
jgi:integrase